MKEVPQCEMLFKAGDLSVKDTDGTQKRYQASIKMQRFRVEQRKSVLQFGVRLADRMILSGTLQKTVLQILRSRIIKQQENIMFMRMQLRQTEI